MKVLIAEDDAHILNALCEILENEGFQPFRACDGEEAFALFTREAPDFLCLDIMMPRLNGYDLCRKIRAIPSDVPIIFLSAKGQEVDKVLGLELGADDYIVKPFGVHEVVARIRAVARRSLKSRHPASGSESFAMGDLTVYPLQLRAVRAGEAIDLSLREIKILSLLHSRKDQVVDRDMLLDACWGAHIMPESRTVDQHIAVLRKRIERDPKNPAIIKTVHGAGYRFETG
jgi:two-component system alkaline phosphatase synthesis response regulator PhoP